MKKIFKYIFCFLFAGLTVLGVEESNPPLFPMIPILPAQPSDKERVPIETKTIIMGAYTEVVVPLEIISDVDIEAMVIDEQEIEVPFEDLQKVSEAFPELPSGECLYDGCLHQGEDGCIVPELVEKGLVDENRYESYLRIIDALRDRKPAYMRNRKSRG